MRRRINQLLKEQFTYEVPPLRLSETEICAQVHENETFRGKVRLEGEQGNLIHGFVSGGNIRVKVNPEMFTGRKQTIVFEADTKGLHEGDVLKGTLLIGTTAGEYQVPYQIEIMAAGKPKEVLPDCTPEAFAVVAREDFAQAYMRFVTPEFREQTKRWGDHAFALYEGILGQTLTYHSLEQFLVGMNLKAPVTLHLSSEHILLQKSEEDVREEVLLMKDTWGFAPVSVSCDADFLTIERPYFTTEEFTGSIFSLGFIVHREKLHAGRNFARITVRAEAREITCTVEVRGRSATTAAFYQMQEILKMMNAYIGWRSKRIGLQAWSGITNGCLINYKKAGGNHIFYELYQIYVLQQSDEQMEADLLLQEVQKRKEELTVPQWKGFYLYLTLSGNADKVYVEYIKNEIRDLYLANQENWILQWLMLKVNANLFKNDSERLDCIRRQYICGCKSPVMYLEAWEILKREPLMMRTLGEFEIHLLRFLCREKLVDRELCGQAAQLAGHIQHFHPLLYDVLCRCYALYPSRNLLTAICALLMKGRKNSSRYAKWFELGVHQDIRLAGLYEYYAMTAEDLNVRELPAEVRMYFSYNNTLSYEKKAAIYANIIRNRSKEEEIYDSYRAGIVLFMEEQLMEGRISRDLALIYDALLTRFVLNEQMTRGLAKALFSYEITCDNPHIRHVIVVHRQLGQEQRVMLSGGRACVQIYHKDCAVLLEDKDGVRYGDCSLYRLERLLSRTDFEAYCRELQQIPGGLLLHDCGVNGAAVDGENVRQFVQLMQLSGIRSSYRRYLQEQLLQYYTQHPHGRYMEEFLRAADRGELCVRHKKELVDLLLLQGLMEQAYVLVEQSGLEHVSANALVRLCSWYIEEHEPNEQAFLVAGCLRCFEKQLYNETVLRYLMHYYEGALGTMKAIWQTGQSFLLEDFVLEERILVLVLFLQNGMQKTEEIFQSYVKKQGKPWLCKAYAVLMCYHYFVKDMPVDQEVFDYIEQYLLGEVGNPQICQLAILRHYAQLTQLTAGQQKWMYYLLDKFTEKGMYFRFYRKFPQKVLQRFHLHDKYILEYRTNPTDHVMLHYRLNGQKEQCVAMQDMYEGIFVKEFTLFYRDRLTWYLTVEKESGMEKTPEQTLTCERRSPRGATGRYELINRLAEAAQKNDRKQLKELREQYIGQQYLVEELFQIN